MNKVKLSPQKRASLQQASVILFLGIAAVIALALLSYSSSDPGVFNRDATFSGNCANWAGCKGAWIADLIYGLLGYVGLFIPIALVVLGLNAFRQPSQGNAAQEGGVNTFVTIVGGLLTLIASVGLAHMLFDPYPVGIGGGMFGKGVAGFFTSTVLGFAGSLLFLLSLFFVGITLVTDISWGKVTEKVGDYVIQLFEKLSNTARPVEQHAATVPAHTQNERVRRRKKSNSDTSLFASTQDWLKTKATQGGGMVSGVLGRIMPKRKGPERGAWRNKEQSPYMNDDLYADKDPLLMDNKPKPQRHEIRTATTSMKARPVQHEVLDDENLQAPDIQTLRQQQSQSAPQAASAAPKKIVKSSSLAGDFQSPLAKRSQMTLPPVSLLNPPDPASERVTQTPESLDHFSDLLVTTLGHYGVKDVQVVASDPGPVITRFELQLPDGTKASKVSGLANDLARNMCVSSVRVVEVIPGRPTIGIEIPNEKRDVVAISEMMESEVYRRSRSVLTLAMGKDIAGNPVVADLARMPHLLVAGTTGSGKSVAVNAMLLSLLYKATPEEVRLILIDPKMLELSSYENIPHLIAPVVTDMKEASNALRWCVAEMERRYMLMAKLKVRNVAGFNSKIMEAAERGEQIPDPLFDPLKSLETQPKALEPLPYIVVVVDEFADMMMVVGKKVEELIARLAQKARASGIHLILATQRPSVDVITGLIKANIPTRVAFQVSTKVDSRTILDQGGAEQLLGYGDMLYMPPGVSMPQRVHGALVTDQEVEDVATYLKQQMEPDYVEGVLEDAGSGDGIPGLESAEAGEEADPLYDEAVAVVTESRRASISYLQRRLKVGYNRAARMIEDMEVVGVVSPVQANGTREVLAPAPVKD